MPKLSLPVIFEIEEQSLSFAGGLVSLFRQEVGDLVGLHGGRRNDKGAEWSLFYVRRYIDDLWRYLQLKR